MYWIFPYYHNHCFVSKGFYLLQRFSRTLQGFTRIFRDLQGVTGIYRDFQGLCDEVLSFSLILTGEYDILLK